MKQKLTTLICLLIGPLSAASFVLGQGTSAPAVRSQEVSDEEGIPVLIKHLPEWESAQKRAIFTDTINGLKATLGERKVFDSFEFFPGTEAVSAPYDTGKLLIIEYPTPQASVDADNRITAFLLSNGDEQTVYRRIGNYNAFVFDAVDPVSASSLLDGVKYEKNVRWLGEDPFAARRAERSFVVTTADIFLSTLLVIVLGMIGSIVAGIAVGIIVFYRREGRRAAMPEFSDAGGMTRLNLDDLTPELASGRFLKD